MAHKAAGRRRKQKTPKRDSADWGDRLADALALELLVPEMLSGKGIRFHASVVTSGNTRFPHWNFYHAGRQIHYWPTSGKWTMKAGGDCNVGGVEPDPLAMISRVVETFGRG